MIRLQDFFQTIYFPGEGYGAGAGGRLWGGMGWSEKNALTATVHSGEFLNSLSTSDRIHSPQSILGREWVLLGPFNTPIRQHEPAAFLRSQFRQKSRSAYSTLFSVDPAKK